jgi:steroid 5-alpha reductase family enzyme
MAEALAVSAGAIASLMVITWIVSGLVKDASIVDLIWGFGFVLAAWTVLFFSAPVGTRGWLLVILTTVWGLRLSIYLTMRNLGKGEDFRYQAMRRKHGDRFFVVSLGTVFGLQALLMWVISLPLQIGIAASHPGVGVSPLDVAGTVLWAVGLFFEAVGDWQLARFKADPANKGKVMDRGLWRYTRHPNYFGDFCVWWGLYLIAAAGGAWWTVVGPILMSALLIRYSGAGLLEKTIGTRRPGYDDYARRTNGFFPGPPRKASHD